ncbi:MAG: AtpZ/AtpI family protein [Candidatus Krumholzibacteria bacterium]
MNEPAFCWIPSFSVSLKKKKDQNRFEGVRQAGLLSTIPALLAISPLIGFFFGRFLDGKFNSDPVFTIIFLILGFVAGAMQTARIIRLANRDLDKKD